MRLTRRSSLLAALATPALAQCCPDRAIRVIIPCSAGGNDPVMSDTAAYSALISRDRGVARGILERVPGLRG